ncbi:acyltransferase [Noviherbaspirillum cavernae]|uniref:Acyltransferase n=1 Tax=Noviherbaspirillum cavernae TaxID=2320862 RepID=A0A418WZS0_9BURK|nr:acyltransferase [Noviherbaspirillum cavernae]RJG05748.1 acyltransferase [Noviherbaspirillum cavernae]
MIKSLEGGRGIAALIVALYHLKIGIDHFSTIRNGYIFVDLFFVLSGFVICAAYSQRLRTLTDCQSFLIRRFGRLFPLLVFSTVFYVAAANIIVFAKRMAIAHGFGASLNNPGALDYLIPNSLEIVSTLTMTHGLGVFDTLILNTPSWSISTEFYAYLLFAALCFVLRGWLRLVAFAMLACIGFAVSVAASINVHNCIETGGCLSLTFDYGFPRTVFSFFMGALTWHLSRRVSVHANALQTIGFAALAATLMAVDADHAVAFAFPFIFALLILAVCKDSGWLAAILKTRPCQVLGERSYSIYMMHMPLVLFFENAAKRVDGVIPSTLVLLLYVLTLVVVSGWTYRFIEDPFRAMFNRIAARRSQTAIHPARG